MDEKVEITETKSTLKPAKPDEKLLELLTEAINSEKRDLQFYDTLIAKAPTKENKDVIRAVKMNTLKSIKLLQQIHTNITTKDHTPKQPNREDFQNASFSDLATKAMFEKLNDVELYRKLYFAFLNLEIRDMLFEIITDKQGDAVRLMYVTK